MALGVGAQLWHMNCCVGGFAMKFPEVVTGLSTSFGGKSWSLRGATAVPNLGNIGWVAQHAKKMTAIAGFIVVDRYGKRYTNESGGRHGRYYELTQYDDEGLFYRRLPSYWVFDQKRMNDGYLTPRAWGPAGPAHLYNWSTDNSKELERGWIKLGYTIKELASILGMEPQKLIETVNNYNSYCEHGQDAEYHRGPNTLIPLDTPPYYAVQLWPGGPNTQGGPRRNAKAQVIRADSCPIPRLYSAGELGSIYGMLYPAGGGNIAECIAFGRIAGENASAHHPL
jgi:succinate dehydrogenase/fumarate reductase flavoprotein subunit